VAAMVGVIVGKSSASRSTKATFLLISKV
jgi:hypothetical protein